MGKPLPNSWVCPKCGFSVKAIGHHYILREIGWHAANCLVNNECGGAHTCCGDRYGSAEDLGQHIVYDEHDWPALIVMSKLREF